MREGERERERERERGEKVAVLMAALPVGLTEQFPRTFQLGLDDCT